MNFEIIRQYLNNASFPLILDIGVLIIFSFFMGRIARTMKLPTIVGYMIAGVVFGSSFLNIISDVELVKLQFIPEIILGFVALNIGLELNFSNMKKQGKGLILTIFTESFGAFIAVFVLVYIFTNNLPLAIIFAAIAPASAPAGTVAVIKEYGAKGKLTSALYTVVGFDDGLGIMIFGVAISIAKFMLLSTHTAHLFDSKLIYSIFMPLTEIGYSILIGLLFAMIFSQILKKTKYISNIFIFIFGFILIVVGLCDYIHLSLIIANMIFGMYITNRCSKEIKDKVEIEVNRISPFFFILFFAIAGVHLRIDQLSSLGILGVVYIVGRSVGLIAGASFGATVGRLDDNLKKYLGLGILSQAGVAIGLSLIVKNELHGIGKIIDPVNNVTMGTYIGNTVLTIITATCIFFEIIGPILTRLALKKSGEIPAIINMQFENCRDAKGFSQTRRLKGLKHYLAKFNGKKSVDD